MHMWDRLLMLYRKREKAEKLWRRGKGPPKKGQGKRAVKRKRK